ncbi:STAS domain-containing protein [Metabacillus arenae]|uniref:STAS domain-containing protein n=1 Tax=Metabacillus arenae TaxID=2771434 RepID=A0A926NHD6_9BACI|nr:STAS domain-containing protein [Metabacillus arenae]MBD1381100.1 STAS domain-containing protein [Metabacillus arenae]
MSEQEIHPTLEKISRKIEVNKGHLLNLITEQINISYPANVLNQTEDLITWRENVIQMYSNSITLNEEEAYHLVDQWGNEAADLLVTINLPLDLANEEIRFYRNLIGTIIKEEAKISHLTLDQFYEVVAAFNSVVDYAIQQINISYMKEYNANLKIAKEAVDELSVPIVRIAEKIGILPLIGDIDTHRAQILLDVALTQSSQFELEHLIIDLSGVPIIDTMVANQIFKVIHALSLIGVETKLSGIRPEIAQTMIQLGLNFKDTDSFSSLNQALEYIGFKIK